MRPLAICLLLSFGALAGCGGKSDKSSGATGGVSGANTGGNAASSGSGGSGGTIASGGVSATGGAAGSSAAGGAGGSGGFNMPCQPYGMVCEAPGAAPCSCTQQGWSCFDPSFPVAAAVVDGSSCPQEGLSCAPKGPCNKCTCTSFTWHCVDDPSCSAACPASTVITLDGEACSDPGLVCQDSGFCKPTCACVYSDKGPVWECSIPPC